LPLAVKRVPVPVTAVPALFTAKVPTTGWASPLKSTSIVNSPFAQVPLLQAVNVSSQNHLRTCGAGAGRSHHVSLVAAVIEELLDGVTQLTVGSETTEESLVIAKAEDLVNRTGQFLNVNTGIAQYRRHIVSLTFCFDRFKGR
jgi:hypothetical protein